MPSCTFPLAPREFTRDSCLLHPDNFNQRFRLLSEDIPRCCSPGFRTSWQGEISDNARVKGALDFTEPWVYPSSTEKPQIAFSGWQAGYLQRIFQDATQPVLYYFDRGTYELVFPVPVQPPLQHQPDPCGYRTHRDSNWAPEDWNTQCLSPRQPCLQRTGEGRSRPELEEEKKDVKLRARAMAASSLFNLYI